MKNMNQDDLQKSLSVPGKLLKMYTSPVPDIPSLALPMDILAAKVQSATQIHTDKSTQRNHNKKKNPNNLHSRSCVSPI